MNKFKVVCLTALVAFFSSNFYRPIQNIVEFDAAHYLSYYLNQKKIVLLDFFATWCAPCNAMDSELEAIARRHPDDVLILKVDIEKFPEIVEEYNASGALPVYVIIDKQGNTRVIQKGLREPVKSYEECNNWESVFMGLLESDLYGAEEGKNKLPPTPKECDAKFNDRLHQTGGFLLESIDGIK